MCTMCAECREAVPPKKGQADALHREKVAFAFPSDAEVLAAAAATAAAATPTCPIQVSDRAASPRG